MGGDSVGGPGRADFCENIVSLQTFKIKHRAWSESLLGSDVCSSAIRHDIKKRSEVCSMSRERERGTLFNHRIIHVNTQILIISDCAH